MRLSCVHVPCCVRIALLTCPPSCSGALHRVDSGPPSCIINPWRGLRVGHMHRARMHLGTRRLYMQHAVGNKHPQAVPCRASARCGRARAGLAGRRPAGVLAAGCGGGGGQLKVCASGRHCPPAGACRVSARWRLSAVPLWPAEHCVPSGGDGAGRCALVAAAACTAATAPRCACSARPQAARGCGTRTGVARARCHLLRGRLRVAR